MEPFLKESKTLHCYFKGDKRFSAFGAEIKFLGKEEKIEIIYQMSKRFGNFKPLHWRDAKGRTPTHFQIENVDFDVGYLSSFYTLLWIMYLDKNPHLVEYAKSFDEFYDKYRGKSKNCQADIIRKYVKEGRETLIKDIVEFVIILRKTFKKGIN